MQEFAASYSDGLSARAHDVVVGFGPQGLVIRGRGLTTVVWPYGDLRSVNPVIPGRPVSLSSRTAPDARLFIDHAGVAEQVLRHCPALSARAKSLRVLGPMLGLAVLLLVLIAMAWRTGYSPARHLAGYIPDPLRQQLGTRVVASVTRERPRCANPAGLAALEKMSARLLAAAGSQRSFRIDVMPLSLVNAFAVPGEHIILTRGLLDVVQTPEELGGVLAHEIGHGLELHPETALVRALGLSALLSLLLGGGDIGGHLGALGSFLLQLSYSRQAEHAADAQAVRILKRAGSSPAGLARFFVRMEKITSGGAARPKGSGGKRGLRVEDITSTHPPTPERLERIIAAIDKTALTTPLLSPREWRALKNICARGETGNTDEQAHRTGGTR